MKFFGVGKNKTAKSNAAAAATAVVAASTASSITQAAAQKGSPSEGSSEGGTKEVYKVPPKTEENPLLSLQTLRECPVADRPELFRKKLLACSILLDFNLTTQQKEKEAKRQTLLEIIEYVNNTRNCFNEAVMQDVVQMVSTNIFRALPPASSGHSPVYDPDDDEPTLECSWPHLQIVYEFFLRFVVCTDVDPKIAKRYIDQNFVLRLLELFNCEDPRERDYLKTILHRIYGKFMALRSFVRKAIQHLFFKFIYEVETHNGLAELLEILGSIINGFALPLKEEHRQFLEKSLIPLHKAKTLQPFHTQLSYCMAQYVEKDPRLAELIIRGLLRYWPVTNTPKAVLFINEVEEILELTQQPEFQKVESSLFKKLAICIESPHFQVAERVLFLWNNEYIVKLINQNRQSLFPIVIGSLYRNSKQHWNSTVHGLTYNVLKLLMEADPQLFDDCSAQNKLQEEKIKSTNDEREKQWQKMKECFDKKTFSPKSSTTKTSSPLSSPTAEGAAAAH
eukprot:GHVL01033912.1.p1 GENE.GHVL01033912.1~~GHVL01033912.1.p1  ORF type:complete len:508 (-),score=92.08 GHVL01033912.1:176-1699(-)